jgi:hypothetical protein
LHDAPRILYIDTSGIFINKNAPYPNEIESLEDMDWERDKIQTYKLKETSYGDLQFKIEMINTKYFDSREMLDKLFVSKDRQTPFSNMEQISIEDALKYFSIELSCNMDYYLKTNHEIEKDLNRNNVNIDLNDELAMKKLEKELFYNQMLKLFGEIEATSDDIIISKDGDDKIFFEKAFILKDFHMLFMDGNYRMATARRGNYYLIFNFVY